MSSKMLNQRFYAEILMQPIIAFISKMADSYLPIVLSDVVSRQPLIGTFTTRMSLTILF